MSGRLRASSCGLKISGREINKGSAACVQAGIIPKLPTMPKQFTSINPASGETIATYDGSTPEAVEAALHSAHEAFDMWRKESHSGRAEVLRRVAEVLRQEKESLARLATQEMGKPIAQSREEIDKSVRCLEFYAENGGRFAADEMAETDALKSYVSYQPLGVVLAIMPWNFPFWQVFRAIGPILAGGNTMVLKHASNVSGCALAIHEVFKKAGVQEGLFQALLLPSSDIAGIIADKRITAVTLTGSTEAGRSVASLCGQHLKPHVLELGGSDAYVVLHDADLDLTVDVCLKGRLVNSGQSCVAAKRFIVVKSLLKEFTARMVVGMEAATYGDGMDESNRIGPLARVDLREDLHDQVQRSVASGARILCGGAAPEGAGAFYPPTVLAGVTPGMPAFDEELFGPVAAIVEAKDETDAMRLANAHAYGLGGAIFSRDRERAESLAARELQAGSCFVNEAVHSDPRLPFGGVKDSGYGRELGSFGMRAFMNAKTVLVK